MPDPTQKPVYLDNNGDPISQEEPTTYLDDNGNPIPAKQPEGESTLGKVWRVANTPLIYKDPATSGIAARTQPALDLFKQQHPYLGTIADYALGALTAPSTPLGMGLEATTAAAPVLKAAGMTKTAELARPASRAAGIGMMGHGAYMATQAGTQPNSLGTGPDLVGAGLEIGLGALGARASRPEARPEPFLRAETPIEPTLDLPLNTPKVEAEPINTKPIEKVAVDENGNAIPDIAESKIVGKASVEFDREKAGKIIGRALYKEGGPKIATKELLQNAIDATRANPNPQINVHFDRLNKSVLVNDNGPGLTLDELQTVFTNIASSGKRGDLESSGRFGFGKAAYLLGGEKAEVSTIVNENGQKMKYTFAGSPDEFLSNKQPDIYGDEVPQDTPTGTVVRVHYPKDTSFYDASDFVKNLSKGSTGLKHQINVSDNYGDREPNTLITTYDLGKNAPKNLANISNEAADTSISIPEGAPRGDSSMIKLNLLNNGLYQTSKNHWLDVPGNNIPKELNIDIRSKVPEDDTQYPWTANREELRGKTDEQIKKYIDENVVNPARNKRKEELTQVYKSMQPVVIPTKGKLPFVIYDTGKLFTPEEISDITRHPKFIQLGSAVSNGINDIMLKLNDTEINKNLDKIGFIFDPSLHGINIPNPEAKGKQAILINPFSSGMNKTPDQASTNMSHTVVHELAHIYARNHDQNFTSSLGDLYARIGRQPIRQLEDNIFNIISDKTGQQLHPEVQNLLQKYTESRGREKAEIDPLLGTGIGAKDPESDRKSQIPVDARSSREGDVTTATDKLLNALTGGKYARFKQDVLYSQERAKRAGQISGVTTPGAKGFFQQLGMLKGELPKVPIDQLLLHQDDVDNLIDAVTNSDLKPYQQINAKMGIMKLMAGAAPQHSEIKLLGQVFGQNFENIVEMNAGPKPDAKWKERVAEAVNVPKSLMASLNFHAPLRQGLPFIYKGAYWGAFKDMFSYYRSDTVYKAAMDAIKERPNYALGESMGLKLTDLDEGMSNREEEFLSKITDKLPHVAGAARAYTGFLNKLRADVFDGMVADVKAAGNFTPEVVKNIAKVVNNGTGRGSLGRFEKNAAELNMAFFSPRTIASRLQMLNPAYYAKLDPYTRLQAGKSLMAVAGFALGVSSLAKLAGANVSLDPQSTDFLKIKVGNTRLDPYGGFQQFVVAGARVLAGIRKHKDITPVLRNFGYNKLSPATRLGTDYILGNRAPQPRGIGADITKNKIGGEMINDILPMTINDLYEVHKDNPNIVPFALLPAMFGATIQDYKNTTGGIQKLRP